MKKVLFYTTVNIADILVQKYYQIDFDIIKKNGYEFEISQNFFDLFKWWKYDILFVYFYTYGFFWALIARCVGRKVIFTGGIDSLDRKSEIRKRFIIQKIFFWLCYQVASKCIIVSDNDWANIKKEYNGRLKKKLIKSYHVVDTDAYGELNKYRSNFFTTICWQGVDLNVFRKGIIEALHLFAYLVKQQEFADYKFKIVGRKGSATPLIEDEVSRLGLENNVEILGEVTEEEKISILKNARYYFQLSSYEGFGLAVLEAEVAGAIIIHSGRGGLKYVVGDFGITVDRNNIDKECQRVYKELLSFDTRKIEQAYQRVLTDFCYESRVKKFGECFASVLNN